jgi:hypothetical protein
MMKLEDLADLTDSQIYDIMHGENNAAMMLACYLATYHRYLTAERQKRSDEREIVCIDDLLLRLGLLFDDAWSGDTTPGLVAESMNIALDFAALVGPDKLEDLVVSRRQKANIKGRWTAERKQLVEDAYQSVVDEIETGRKKWTHGVDYVRWLKKQKKFDSIFVKKESKKKESAEQQLKNRINSYLRTT